MSHFEELEALNESRINFNSIEMPTPHKVAVLMLVQQYLKAKKAAADVRIMFSSQSRRNFCMLLLKLIAFPDMTYNDLHHLLNIPRYKIDAAHLEGFEAAMSNLFSQGIEVLFDFAELENIEKMLAEELGCSQFSIVGLYIRRVGVILERLSFPQMMALYKNMCLYYEKGVRSLNIGPGKNGTSTAEMTNTDSVAMCVNEESTDQTMESVLDTDTVHQDRNPHSKWSPKQADLFVTQQCKLLEHNELRALPPIELHTKLNEIIQDNPLNSQAYFLSYMNQLRLLDFNNATDALHRAFDRSPLQMMSQQQEQKGFQYLSLNLAVLHSSFHHKKEALNALKECIMLAQECGDKRCLDLANSWFCLLSSSRTDPFEKSLPDLQDPGLVQSLSLAIQYVVKFGAQCGYLPLDLFELLMKSDDLNIKNSILEHVADSMALRSSLWCLYGRHEMSALYSQLLLNLKKTWPFGDIGNTESVCKVLANQALWLSIQGEQKLSAVVLHHARERFPRQPHANNWMISEYHIFIQQAIYRGNWRTAMKLCCQLYLLDKNAGNLQRAKVYVAKRYNSTARMILEEILCAHDLDLLTNVRALVMLAYTTINNDSSISSQTVDLLMHASVLAAGSYMDYEHAIIDMVLAQVMLQMKLPQKAFQAAKNCMEKIYTSGGVYDRSKMDFTFVRCAVAAAEGTQEKKKCLQRSISNLERAANGFKKLDAHAKVLDVYAYASQTFNQLEDIAQRNKYACKFKQYYIEYPVAREYLGMIF